MPSSTGASSSSSIVATWFSNSRSSSRTWARAITARRPIANAVAATRFIGLPFPHQHPRCPVPRAVLRPPKLVLGRPHLLLRLEQRLPLGLLLDPHAAVEVDHELARCLVWDFP